MEPGLPPAGTVHEERIRASKFDLLISQSWPTPFISITMCALIVFILREVQDQTRLLAWFALVTLSGILRLLFFQQYRKRRPPPEDIPRWEVAYRATVFLYFAIWGVGGLWVMPDNSQLYQLFVLYFLIGLSGGAISVFPADRTSLIIAICCLLIPSFAWLVLRGDPLSVVCAVAGAAYLISASRSSRVLSETFTENLDLTERLAAARTSAEQMSGQLSDALSDAREANEAKSLFFNAAHHDLRQPIQAAKVMVTSLANRELEGPSAQMVGGIRSSLETLSNQLDGFLELSRLAAGAMPVYKSDFRLDETLRSLEFEYTPLAAERGISLSLDCAGAAPVHTDPVLLERIIRNLLANAMTHNSDCGIHLSVTPRSNYFMLTVADTGNGIPDDKQRLVFEEFYQLEQDGSEPLTGLGLGLSIVQRLQLLLDLQMHMESREGEGTRFTFRVPAQGA